MRYLESTFSVGLTSPEYTSHWERTFRPWILERPDANGVWAVVARYGSREVAEANAKDGDRIVEDPS